ncbi:dipeptide ABC transporter ATP-binding protein [Streptomyces sp. NPDC021098]|uniref:dipeptide ABC transporter ATP-binding protein n=1 Tax=unclassified Streptomyces TaxID=2593676 RepID=UPI0037B42F9E
MSDPRPLLQVTDLTVTSDSAHLVRGVALTLARGERLGIIGESGSGKTLTALAVLGLLDDGLTCTGSVRLGGVPFDLVGAGDRQLSAVRGKRTGMVFQEPLTALNPVRRVGAQIVEAMQVHGTRATRTAAHADTVDLLERLRLPDPQRAARAHPHQLSGGQRQRGVLAIALANDPDLLICDEPTTALDVTVQKEIVDLIVGVSEERGSAVLFISHDLALVSTVCHRVLVMYGGQIVESGPVADVLRAPGHPYTRALLTAGDLTPGTRSQAIPGTVPAPGELPEGCPFRTRCRHADARCEERPPLADDGHGRAVACWHHDAADTSVRTGTGTGAADTATGTATNTATDTATAVARTDGEEPLLAARGLTRRYPGTRTGLFGRRAALTALEDVDLALHAGRRVGVVGESGAGKSTLLRLLAGLDRPTDGTVTRRGPGPGAEDRGVQMVFQDPMTSLDPRMRVRDIIAEPLSDRRSVAAADRVSELLTAVGLPQEAAERYPHQFSGGQRQRIAIARALAPRPSVLLADEPVSALDVSVRAQILDLLRDVTVAQRTALCVISHDLGVIRYLCHTVLVLRGGKVVESGPVEEIWGAPAHPYTAELLRAVPVLGGVSRGGGGHGPPASAEEQ